MSDDWKVGDLAVTIDNTCPDCVHGSEESGVGIYRRVTRVIYNSSYTSPGLLVDALPAPKDGGGWCACGFRKIRPDEHEDCEPEFIELLKRSKRKVGIDA